MAFCEKILVPRVRCDESFYIEDIEFAIPVGEIPVPPGSEISGVVTVTVLECNPRIDLELNAIFADLVFMIQKELVIEPPEGEGLPIPLEFGFRFDSTVQFRKCTPLEMQAINPDFLEDVVCHVVYVFGLDEVTVNPSTVDPVTGELLNDATIDEELTIQIKLKLLQDRQLIMSLCDPTQGVDIDIETPNNG